MESLEALWGIEFWRNTQREIIGGYGVVVLESGRI